MVEQRAAKGIAHVKLLGDVWIAQSCLRVPTEAIIPRPQTGAADVATIHSFATHPSVCPGSAAHSLMC